MFHVKKNALPTCSFSTLFVGRNSHIIDQRINHIKQQHRRRCEEEDYVKASM